MAQSSFRQGEDYQRRLAQGLNSTFLGLSDSKYSILMQPDLRICMSSSKMLAVDSGRNMEWTLWRPS